MIELRYFEAIRAACGEAFSGLARRSGEFTRRSFWVPDITVPLPGGRTLLVEYDGHYWQTAKEEVDIAKTRDLLASGALVARLRETPLNSLGIDSADYLEIPVHPTAADPAGTADAIQAWTLALRQMPTTGSGGSTLQQV